MTTLKLMTDAHAAEILREADRRAVVDNADVRAVRRPQ